MEIELLNKGIAIIKDIDIAETQLAQIRKLYSKKNNLSDEDIERLFALASSYNEVILNKLHETLKKL
jgi:hypothetical protein